MFSSYIIVFIAGGTFGFVIACILAADKVICERSNSSITDVNRSVDTLN